MRAPTRLMQCFPVLPHWAKAGVARAGARALIGLLFVGDSQAREVWAPQPSSNTAPGVSLATLHGRVPHPSPITASSAFRPLLRSPACLICL